jgi:hypothetical protein
LITLDLAGDGDAVVLLRRKGEVKCPDADPGSPISTEEWLLSTYGDADEIDVRAVMAKQAETMPDSGSGDSCLSMLERLRLRDTVDSPLMEDATVDCLETGPAVQLDVGAAGQQGAVSATLIDEVTGASVPAVPGAGLRFTVRVQSPGVAGQVGEPEFEIEVKVKVQETFPDGVD